MEDPQGNGESQASAPTSGALFYEVEPQKNYEVRSAIVSTNGDNSGTNLIVLGVPVLAISSKEWDFNNKLAGRTGWREFLLAVILATKGCVGLTSFMILLSVVFCLARGKYDYTFYLMAINVLISAIIILFTCFWYKSGDLDASKWWFLILVSAVIVFQCITTDIYVFQHENPIAASTLAPPTTKPGFVTLQPGTSLKALFGQAAGQTD